VTDGRPPQAQNEGLLDQSPALRGTVKLPADFDERAALTEELQQKRGAQG